MKNNDKVLVALITGVAVGALLGVLFAPHKGTKTRRIIQEEGNHLVDVLRETLEEGLGVAGDLKEDIMKVVSDTADEFTKDTSV